MQTKLKTSRAHPIRSRRRAFTLLEVVIVTVLMGLLMALVAVAVSSSIRTARKGADQLFLRSMAIGVEQFRADFGFLPPLVDDANPIITVAQVQRPRLQSQDAQGNPLTLAQLNDLYGTDATTVPRYSVYSLPFYLLGSLSKDIDGVDGAGFTTPQENGGFSRTGKAYAPLFDLGNNSERYRKGVAPNEERGFLLDRALQPIRFYTWTPRYYDATDPRAGTVSNYRTPFFIGDPREDVKLRAGGFAIVSTGSDIQIDEGLAASTVNKDNIVETGQ
ncbi:hypothetical protein BH11PLA1_BH11PLA1_11500 [soil metagenome]